MKDTLTNIETTGEFVCNLSTWETRGAMNRTFASFPPEVNEMEMVGVKRLASKFVNVPRVAEALVHLECSQIKSVEISHWSDKDCYVIVLGEVVGVHIRDVMITTEGLIDVARMQLSGRLGYNYYTVVNSSSIFTMKRPE